MNTHSSIGALPAGGLVHPDAEIGAGCAIGPFAIVEEGAVVGRGCVLEPFARVCREARIGDGTRLGQGAIVGGAPQHLAWSGGPAPCVVGRDVRLGEYATVHGGMAAATDIGDGAMVMAYAHVGHDCVVGSGAVVANAVQLAGHVRVGRGANLGGGTLVHQHVRIGEYAFVAGGIRLDADLAPWSKALGSPARWSGLNRIALERAGWGRARIAAAESALRRVFRKRLRLEEAIGMLIAGATEEDRELAAFCKEGGRGLLRPAH